MRQFKKHLSYEEVLQYVQNDNLQLLEEKLLGIRISSGRLSDLLVHSKSAHSREILFAHRGDISAVDKVAFLRGILSKDNSTALQDILEKKYLELSEREINLLLNKACSTRSLACIEYLVETQKAKTVYDSDCKYFWSFENPKDVDLIIYLLNHGSLRQGSVLENLRLQLLLYFKEINATITDTNQASLIAFCRAVLTVVDEDTSASLDFELKQLATVCAIILNDDECAERVLNRFSEQETTYLNSLIKRELLSKPLHADSKKNDVYAQIQSILKNPSLCIELLGDLEKELGERYRHAGVDVTALHRNTHFLTFLNSPWSYVNSKTPTVQTHHIFSQLLLEKERQYGLNTDPNAPVVFAEFVPTEFADAQIKAGNIFTEYTKRGNMLHGKESHRLQWRIIFRAIEKGLIDTQGLSIKEIYTSCASVWTECFDTYISLGTAHSNTHFRSPMYVNAFLMLLKSELPNISSTLLNIQTRAIQRVSQQTGLAPAKIIAQYDDQEGRFFNRYPTPTVEEYYQSKSSLQVLCRGGSGTVFYKTRKHSTPIKPEEIQQSQKALSQ